MSTLAPIYPIDQNSAFYSNNPNDPRSGFYVPPPGTYQNDQGQIVSKDTPNSLMSAADTLKQFAANTLVSNATNGAINSAPSVAVVSNTWALITDPLNLVVVIVGLILLSAGIFSFKASRDVIAQGFKAAKTTSELAA